MLDIQETRDAVDKNTDWDSTAEGELVLRVHSAMVRMGTTALPLEGKLRGLTYSQWQHETAKRATLAVLDYLIEHAGSEER